VSLGDAIAPFLLQRADILRPLPTTVADSGETTVDYVPLASGVRCRLSGTQAGTPQREPGHRIEHGPRALFLLPAPVLTQDRIIVEGVTYLVTFASLRYDDVGPSHRLALLERVAVPPMVDPPLPVAIHAAQLPIEAA